MLRTGAVAVAASDAAWVVTDAGRMGANAKWCLQHDVS